MSFTTFDKTAALFAGEPHLTIQKRGTITLNAAAFGSLDEPGAVELLYDTDHDVLGMRPADVGLPHVAFVRRSTRSPAGPWVVSAMAFVRHFGIDTGVARQRVAYLDDGVLCVRMDDPGTVVSKTPQRVAHAGHRHAGDTHQDRRQNREQDAQRDRPVRPRPRPRPSRPGDQPTTPPTG